MIELNRRPGEGRALAVERITSDVLLRLANEEGS